MGERVERKGNLQPQTVGTTSQDPEATTRVASSSESEIMVAKVK